MRVRRIELAIILVTLAGCATLEEPYREPYKEPAGNYYKEPAIVHIDNSIVVVEFWVGYRSDTRATMREVTRVAKGRCARAVYHSETCEMTTYAGEHVKVCQATFACK